MVVANYHLVVVQHRKGVSILLTEIITNHSGTHTYPIQRIIYKTRSKLVL